jgi:alpha-amylase
LTTFITVVGIISKLDYIAGMGFDAIWISPMTANTPDGYHGYWPLHFFKVNENFGTESDLKTLVRESHKRGIWVMFDVVANRTNQSAVDRCNRSRKSDPPPLDESLDVADVGYASPAEVTPFNLTEYYHANCEVSDWNNQNQVENCALAGLPDLNQNHPFVVQKFSEWINWVVRSIDLRPNCRAF